MFVMRALSTGVEFREQLIAASLVRGKRDCEFTALFSFVRLWNYYELILYECFKILHYDLKYHKKSDKLTFTVKK